MGKTISEESKIKQKRGIIGENYHAWIQAREFSTDLGTANLFTDWKTGRQMHFMSMGELNTYLMLRYNEKVINIYEQYPLSLDQTNAIADLLGYRPANNGETRMTTDLLVELNDGTYIAVCIKGGKDSISLPKHRRTVEKLYIEMLYWEKNGIPWKLIFSKDFVDQRAAHNIQDCSYYWSPLNVTCKVDLLKYLIIHHQSDISISEKINFVKKAEELITDSSYESFMKARKNLKKQSKNEEE